MPPSDVPPLTLTVLIVEEDADMRRYLRGCLCSLEPAHFVEATDGREALYLARALTPDLIISDIVMPGLSGLDLCRALKADPAHAATPVLLISGEPARTPVNADAVLIKPFNAERLRTHVERLLARPR